MNDDLYRAMLNDGIIREDVISKMADRIAFLSQRLADARQMGDLSSFRRSARPGSIPRAE